MASEVPTEGSVIVDMGDAQFVPCPDSLEEERNSVVDSSEAAQWGFSFSVKQAALLAGLEADFLRPL